MTDVLRRAPSVVFEVADGRAVLLDDSGTRLITLNAVGTAVWQELADARTLDDLVDALHTRFPDQPRTRLVDDCAAFVGELRSNGLLDADG